MPGNRDMYSVCSNTRIQYVAARKELGVEKSGPYFLHEILRFVVLKVVYDTPCLTLAAPVV